MGYFYTSFCQLVQPVEKAWLDFFTLPNVTEYFVNRCMCEQLWSPCFPCGGSGDCEQGKILSLGLVPASYTGVNLVHGCGLEVEPF